MMAAPLFRHERPRHAFAAVDAYVAAATLTEYRFCHCFHADDALLC